MPPKNITESVVRELRILVTKSPLFNLFIIFNAFKLVAVHCIMDTYRIDSFIVIILSEYMLSSFLYSFLPVIIGGRWLLTLFYLAQVLYIVVSITYNLIYSSNIHIEIASTLLWEFRSVYTEALSWELAISLLVALIDLPLFFKLFREFATVKRMVTCDSGLSFRHLAGGLVLLLLVITSVNAYEFVQSGESPADVKTIENYSLHHYGMFAGNYLELYHYRNAKESIHKLNYGRQNNAAIITGTKRKEMEIPSFFLIQVESLDANIINQTWHGRYVTPFLNKLSKSSLYFPYTLSYHLAGGTSDTEMTILNNTEPLSDTPTISINNYSFPNSLPRILKNNGVSVNGFHGNIGEYYNRNIAYSAMGFDILYDQSRMRLESEGWGVSDGKVFNFALNKLAKGTKPYFNYIITMSSHEPFRNVYNYYKTDRYNDVEPAKTRDYFVSVEYVDSMLESLVTQIRRRRPNTYIYIFGDHTPYVLTRGAFKIASFDLDNKKLEFVPLFIITPDGRKRRENLLATSFLDIAPSILNVSNANYKYSAMGENLLGSFGQRQIPFKGKNYDRRDLFELAKRTTQMNRNQE